MPARRPCRPCVPEPWRRWAAAWCCRPSRLPTTGVGDGGAFTITAGVVTRQSLDAHRDRRQRRRPYGPCRGRRRRATTITASWDGITDAGVPAPPGGYTLTLTSAGPTGPALPYSAAVTLHPPVELTGPAQVGYGQQETLTGSTYAGLHGDHLAGADRLERVRRRGDRRRRRERRVQLLLPRDDRGLHLRAGRARAVSPVVTVPVGPTHHRPGRRGARQPGHPDRHRAARLAGHGLPAGSPRPAGRPGHPHRRCRRQLEHHLHRRPHLLLVRGRQRADLADRLHLDRRPADHHRPGHGAVPLDRDPHRRRTGGRIGADLATAARSDGLPCRRNRRRDRGRHVQLDLPCRSTTSVGTQQL